MVDGNGHKKTSPSDVMSLVARDIKKRETRAGCKPRL
jgi:hypothetical protein